MNLYTNKKPCICRSCNKTLPTGTLCTYTEGKKETHFICKRCIVIIFNQLTEVDFNETN